MTYLSIPHKGLISILALNLAFRNVTMNIESTFKPIEIKTSIETIATWCM